MQTFEKLTNILSTRQGIEPSTIKMDTKFCDLNLDSLDMLDFVLLTEEEMQISIELNSDLNTVGRVASYIDKKQAAVL